MTDKEPDLKMVPADSVRQKRPTVTPVMDEKRDKITFAPLASSIRINESIFDPSRTYMSRMNGRDDTGMWSPDGIEDVDDRLRTAIWDRAGANKRQLWDVVKNEVGIEPRAHGSIQNIPDRAKDLQPAQLYFLINASGRLNYGNSFRELRETVIPRLNSQGLLTEESEAELIITHYYDTLFAQAKLMMESKEALVRQTIQAQSNVVRIPYQEQDTLTTAAIITTKKFVYPSGAELEIDAGSYTYTDATCSRYRIKTALEDVFAEDVNYDVMALEVERQGYILAWIANHLVEQELYDNATTNEDLTETAMAAADFRIAAAGIDGYGMYTPKVCIMHSVHKWGLLADTNIGYDAYYGGPEAIRQAQIPLLYGIGILKESGVYFGNANGNPGALMVDPSYAGFFVQRYPPRAEQWRDMEKGINKVAMVWRACAKYWHANASYGYTT